jgi:dipeptidyl-peptidase-4
LQDPLLFIHGMRDDTVLFKDTLTLAQRLILDDKDFEIAVLPNAPHGWDTQGLAQTRYAFRRLVEFFDRHLKPEAAPSYQRSSK